MIDLPIIPNEHDSSSLPEIFQLIEGLERRLARFQVCTLRESRLTPPQYYILKLLTERNNRPFKELADELACTRATMTGLVDTLEKKNLVKRVPHAADRRSMLVQLTEVGQDVLRASPGLEEIFGSCCTDVLPSEETQELIRLLKKLSTALPF